MCAPKNTRTKVCVCAWGAEIIGRKWTGGRWDATQDRKTIAILHKQR